jgi:membrane dipeptidase
MGDRVVGSSIALVGARHVGLGLDYAFDLAEMDEFVKRDPTRFPPALDGSPAYRQVEPKRIRLIAEELLRRGYDEVDVQGIIGHNNLRVAQAVWDP